MPARPDLLALLRAIKADPDDDTAKLVLADWLEEQPGRADHALGEYVRLMCDLNRPAGGAGGGEDSGPRLHRLGELWDGLVAGCWRRLTDAGLGFDYDTQPRPEYGGLVTVRADAKALLAPPALALAGTEALAWVGDLWVDKARSREIEALADAPLVEVPVSVVVGGSGRDQTPAVCRLVASPRLGGLLELHTIVRRGGRVVEAIAGNPVLARLRVIGLGDANLTDGDLAALLGVSHLGGLRALELPRNRLTAAAARVIAETPSAARLTRLYLSGNQLGDEGAGALIASRHLPRRLTLDVSQNDISRGTAERLRRRFGRTNVST